MVNSKKKPLSSARQLLGSTLLIVSTCAGLNSGAPRMAAAAAPPQAGLSACRYGGILLVPKVDAGHAYGWGFVANFDHAQSGTLVTTCLAERSVGQAPWQTTYTVATTHCGIVTNGAAAAVGGGVANFNGNFKLSCSLPVPATSPTLFWVKARAALNAPSSTHTFMSGTIIGAGYEFGATTDAACGVTLNSAYPAISFAHSASGACGAMTEYGSRVTRTNVNALNGAHKIGAAVLGPVSASGVFELPGNFSFEIGDFGELMALDWFVIDPTPSRCCSPG